MSDAVGVSGLSWSSPWSAVLNVSIRVLNSSICTSLGSSCWRNKSFIFSKRYPMASTFAECTVCWWLLALRLSFTEHCIASCSALITFCCSLHSARVSARLARAPTLTWRFWQLPLLPRPDTRGCNRSGTTAHVATQFVLHAQVSLGFTSA